ncbi:hypothetical protein [Mesorhizobium sp.]|uniref:hypothetical protein n=1 Tax=Mesorhizobium sp. TaxID=1871066 RepID=UPI00257D7BAD|nr:hypothetical protein [Mesorhizobium sp.]
MTDDYAFGHGDDHKMVGFAEIRCQPIRPDRFIEHILGDPHHKGVIALVGPYDFHMHCVKSPKSAYKLLRLRKSQSI